MRVLAAKSVFLSIWASMSYLAPAGAHVKWFLNRPESELLKQPKPALFTHLSAYNSVPIMFALAFFYLISFLNAKFSNSFWNKNLLKFAGKSEPVINLVMAIGFSMSLISCGLTRTLLVPDFIICSHCPQWLAPAEILIGALLLLGLFSRVAMAGVLVLMYMAIVKHGVMECMDALPLFGLTAYFMIVGRNRFSLDNVLRVDRICASSILPIAHTIVRWTMGLGLIILALDEKLLHPQLAMNLLQYVPSLDPIRSLGCDNAMFVLITGLVELLIGACVLFGVFPRMAMFVMLPIFSATTMIFGWKEFFGHAACYGIILSIMCWGAGSPAFTFNLEHLLAYVRKEALSFSFKALRILANTCSMSSLLSVSDSLWNVRR